MLKKIMIKAEGKRVKTKSPQEVVDALVASFFDALAARVSQSSATISYLERIELLTASTLDFNEHKKKVEADREVKEADRVLGEFTAIFEAHTQTFWQYVEKVQEANWLSHKEAVRHAWTRWATKAERTISLIQTKSAICIKNLKLYNVKYAKIAQLKKLNKLTSEQLFKAWLNKKNPITGSEIES